MKTIKTIKTILTVIAIIISVSGFTQNRNLDNYRSPDKDGINVFETPKDTVSTFENIKVRIGGAFALQFQAIGHENAADEVLNDNGANINQLYAIGNNFNLATANLDIDVALFDGINLHLRTYLSSRHHPEPYVKGGYITIDNLNFIEEGFLSEIMKSVTVKIGHMENNYGDSHFRRSDNAQALYNPFVGNYIMDAFTTEVGAEVYYQNNHWLAMLGVTNGKLNQTASEMTTSPSTIAKLGYDRQMNDDLRLRLTGSVYHTAHSSRTYLYSGDRAGSRYYFVLENAAASSSANYTSGRFNPGLNNELTAIMFNPFVKYKGIEFFGLVEVASGKTAAETDTRDFTHIGAELLYRFGANENFYIGGRYNNVSGEIASGEDVDITRFNLGAGYFMTKNILAKLEYVNQKYDGFASTDRFHEGKFNGVVFEAVISF